MNDVTMMMMMLLNEVVEMVMAAEFVALAVAY
jgi:hypothetical protein